LALGTRDSGVYRVVNGQVERRRRPARIRGLNWNHNHEMKNLFKAAATTASMRPGVFREFYLGLPAKGMRPEMARLTLARKIAAIALRYGRKEKASTPNLSARLFIGTRPGWRGSAMAERSGSRASILAGLGARSLTGHRMLPRTTQESIQASSLR